MINYTTPSSWIKFDRVAVALPLAEAKGAILSLQALPLQRSWVDALQEIELKREIAGTSRIEGADFTEREFDEALNLDAQDLKTHSQRQARAAKIAYEFVGEIPDDRPISSDLIRDIHARMVKDCDDDHCVPGQLRQHEQNVHFGTPPHRGANGGTECEAAFEELVNALAGEYREHDPILQALAAHYHFASMHPFLDGNGRTARALEALMLRRAGLKNECFISMSNYYYDTKTQYLNALAETRSAGHDLTRFITFALTGIQIQCERFRAEVQVNLEKALYRNLMYDLFNRMMNKRKRVLRDRQIAILNLLLDNGEMELEELMDRCEHRYKALKREYTAFARDITDLIHLEAIEAWKESRDGIDYCVLTPRLKWATETTEASFMQKLRTLPTAKTHPFLNR